VLTDEQVGFFLENGYLHLPGAIPRSLVDDWVAEAHQRLRETPGQVLKSYLPEIRPAFDLEDPATWRLPRVDLLGHREISFEEIAPSLWGAMADLLGGPARIRTRVLSNYFILRLPGFEQLDDSWHVDDPRRQMRLDGFVNGLVGFVLFSDVHPEGGASQLLPESLPLLVRRMAASPGGLDLVDLLETQAIAARCSRVVPCAGAAGDVFLAHGLMLHRASTNRTEQIRWLGNPMIHLHEPLDPQRPDPASRSPVEALIARALAAP
jgi:hypothetical protein